MAVPPRMVPLLEQFDFARQRLTDRIAGPPETAWRAALVSADDAALDKVGHSTYPNGSDASSITAWESPRSWGGSSVVQGYGTEH